MSNEVERVAAALFENTSKEVAEIKFFGGSRANATADDLAAEVGRVDAQLRAGTVEVSDILDAETHIPTLVS